MHCLIYTHITHARFAPLQIVDREGTRTMKSTDIQQIFDRIKALVDQMVDQNDGICIKAITITGDTTLHATVEGVTEGSSYQADVTARIDNGKFTHSRCSVIEEPPPKKAKKAIRERIRERVILSSDSEESDAEPG